LELARIIASKIIQFKQLMKVLMKDVFICHASEDKNRVVEPLVTAFKRADISYWYDKAEIKWGESITQKVNEGLNISRFVIVVLSQAFLNKNFPQRELFSSLNREIYSQEVKILPLIAVSNQEEKENILKSLPFLSDKAYQTWDGNADKIIEALLPHLSKKNTNLNFQEIEEMPMINNRQEILRSLANFFKKDNSHRSISDRVISEAFKIDIHRARVDLKELSKQGYIELKDNTDNSGASWCVIGVTDEGYTSES
jgi:hypothetical protein